MQQQGIHMLAIIFAMMGGVSACASNDTVDQAVFEPEYLGVDTLVLGDDLVSLFVTMRGARNRADVAAYADCAAAGYAMDHDYGFARHVRTTIDDKNGVWSGDTVYTISAALPQGLKTIDAEVTLSDCIENGIPRV